MEQPETYKTLRDEIAIAVLAAWCVNQIGPGHADPLICQESAAGSLQNSRCNAQSTGGRVMEIYFPPDVTFTEEGHAYFLKGQRVPFSLTEILDLSGICRQRRLTSLKFGRWDHAGKRGTKVSEYTLWSDQGELDLDDLKPYPEYYNRVLGWQQFRQDFNFQPDLTMCEVPIAVRCNGMLYAMKLDAYGVIGEGEQIAYAVVEKKCTADEEGLCTQSRRRGRLSRSKVSGREALTDATQEVHRISLRQAERGQPLLPGRRVYRQE